MSNTPLPTRLRTTLVVVAVILAWWVFLRGAGAATLVRGQFRTNLVVRWKYPLSEMSTGSIFKIYSSSSITNPSSNWSCVAEVPGTNLTWSIPVSITGRQFFLVSCSNVWGESGFSIPAEQPPRPLDRVDLTIE